MECTVQDLKRMQDTGAEFLLLDVRTAEEIATARIGNETHIPLHELQQRLDTLRPWQHKQIVCMCHHGVRSAIAGQCLREAGFTDVWNLAGGIHAWSEEIDPAVPVYS